MAGALLPMMLITSRTMSIVQIIAKTKNNVFIVISFRFSYSFIVLCCFTIIVHDKVNYVLVLELPFSGLVPDVYLASVKEKDVAIPFGDADFAEQFHVFGAIPSEFD